MTPDHQAPAPRDVPHALLWLLTAALCWWHLARLLILLAERTRDPRLRAAAVRRAVLIQRGGALILAAAAVAAHYLTRK